MSHVLIMPVELSTNCFNFYEQQWVELNDGDFFSVIQHGIDDGKVSKRPGQYVLIDFSGSPTRKLTWGSGLVGGALFTIDDNHKVVPGHGHTGQVHVPRLTTWPPK